MRLLYDLGIWFYTLLLRLISPFHPKAKRWVAGREGLMAHIAQSVEKGQRHIWFHFASLGEFEQGRSVLEVLKKSFPQEKVIITFFSPSGYDIRKNTDLADHVFYLPSDTAQHAKEFIALIQPKFVVFTKYEYWYHYFKELWQRDIRLLMISAIFREDQIFFKPYGGFFKGILRNVSYYFTQDVDSVHMLKWIGITQAGLAGDTRFDRVVALPRQHKPLAPVEQFTAQANVLVAGSTWAPDERLLATLAEAYSTWKFIVAPHEVDASHIAALKLLFPKALLYSQFSSYSAAEVTAAKVLIIDNIGMLSALYYYADVAYIGGGFGAGIHNTLEAATYGIPVVFGPKYGKFKEAEDLVTLMAGFSIASQEELNSLFVELQDGEKRQAWGMAAQKYVQQNAGATQIIMKYLQTEKLLH